MHMRVLKWCTSRFVFLDTHQKAICCYEIGLCAQNKDIILGSLVNKIERAYNICRFYLVQFSCSPTSTI